MTLERGTRLGSYAIESPIGAGGMGEVYKARDTRLDRRVAIKVLPEHVASDPDLKQRFEREAKTISSLNHPHICTLYDIGSQDGIDFLVMEYLEGGTLAQRLVKGALPLDQALRIAIEIADALDMAHRHGITHRDLKPGNIFLTNLGSKLLDFGLAKLGVRPTFSGRSGLTTMSADLTGEGTLVGTLQYMAPEQIEGKEVDARTDIWAFGCVLHEILTGEKAFAGDSQAGLLVAILEREPAPLTTSVSAFPPALARVVHKCLAKRPDGRWHSAADLADNLRWLVDDSSETTSAVPAVSSTASKRLGWLRATLAAVLLGVLAAGGWWSWTRDRPAPAGVGNLRHRQVTFRGDIRDAALSPDGRTLAYAVGDPGSDVWSSPVRVMVRDLAGGQALELFEGTLITELRWMPDGSTILVSAQLEGIRGVFLIPRLGGTPRQLPGLRVAPLFAVSPDGAQVAGASQNTRALRVVPVSGGEDRTIPLDETRWIYDIEWSPKSTDIAVVGQHDDGTYGVWLVAAEGAAPRRVLAGEEALLSACWSPIADVLYVERQTYGGTELLRLVPGAGVPQVLLSGLPAGGSCQVSSDGLQLLHLRGVDHANLWLQDLTRPELRPTVLTVGTGIYSSPNFAPDGRWVSATFGSQWPLSDPEIVKIPLATGGGDSVPMVRGYRGRWSPDGRRFAFTSRRSGTASVWVGGPEGELAAELPESDLANGRLTWLPDGRLAWRTPDARNYLIRDLTTEREEFLVADPSVGWVFWPRFSPNGDQVAVFWNRAERGLWVLSWPERIEHFVAPFLTPVGWSADGLVIYAYQRSSREIVKVDVEGGTSEVVAQFPVGGLGDCDQSADRRYAVCSAHESDVDAWIIDNFDPLVPSSQ